MVLGLFGPTQEKVEKWTAEKNVKKLIGALSANDGALRRMAAEGLAKVRGPDVLEYCQANAKNPDQKTRWAITQILGMIGTPEAMKVLSTVRDPASDLEDKARQWKAAREKKE